MLEATILDQVRSIFQPLEARYTFHITCNPEHEQAGEMIDFLNDIASCSDKLSCQVTETDEPKLEFTLLKEGKETVCRIAKEAGVDFVKTSTGFGTAGANVHDVALMRRVVGPVIGVKAAGGIRDLDTALALIQVGATRIGTSSGIQIVEAYKELKKGL